MIHTPRGRLIASAAAIALVVAACGSDESGEADTNETDSSEASASEYQVVTTVAPITSIAANVIGDCAEIVGIVPEGTNSHTFEPPPSAAEVMSTADIVFINGLHKRWIICIIVVIFPHMVVAFI